MYMYTVRSSRSGQLAFTGIRYLVNGKRYTVNESHASHVYNVYHNIQNRSVETGGSTVWGLREHAAIDGQRSIKEICVQSGHVSAKAGVQDQTVG